MEVSAGAVSELRMTVIDIHYLKETLNQEDLI